MDTNELSAGLTPAAWINAQLSKIPEYVRVEIFKYCNIEKNKNFYTYNELLALILRAAEVTNDAVYGHCKTPIPVNIVEFEMRIFQTGETLEEALELARRFSSKFSPTKVLELADNGETVIFTMTLDGHDEDHAGIAEVSLLTNYYFTLCSFLGKQIPIKNLYTRSITATSLADRNFFTDSLKYNTFSGLEFEKRYLKMPRASDSSADLWSETIRLSLLYTKIKPILSKGIDSIIKAETILNASKKTAEQKNIILSEKRVITYNNASYNLRDLQNSKKIADSAMLLCTSTLEIDEIASRLGFPDAASFQRFFYGYSSFSPEEYREKFSERFALKDGQTFDLAMKIASEIFT